MPDLPDSGRSDTDRPDGDRIAVELVALREAREVSYEDERRIKQAIQRLHNLPAFPFTALELSSAVEEEQVADTTTGQSRARTLLALGLAGLVAIAAGSVVALARKP